MYVVVNILYSLRGMHIKIRKHGDNYPLSR